MAIEVAFVHLAVAGVAAAVLRWAPGADVVETAIRLALAEGALAVYAAIAWWFNPTVDHHPAGIKVAGTYVDDPFTMKDDAQRARQGLWFLFLPGQLLVGAVLDVLAFFGGDDG